jgi:hypothetical protein
MFGEVSSRPDAEQAWARCRCLVAAGGALAAHPGVTRRPRHRSQPRFQRRRRRASGATDERTCLSYSCYLKQGLTHHHCSPPCWRQPAAGRSCCPRPDRLPLLLLPLRLPSHRQAALPTVLSRLHHRQHHPRCRHSPVAQQARPAGSGRHHFTCVSLDTATARGLKAGR